MQQAGVISAYLESLTDALGFDRALASSVRQEVEDHLYEAAATDSLGDRHDAERRAVATFGDPYAIAAQFAVVSLAKQSRRVAAAVILVIASTFLTMKARVAWYAATQWAMNEEMKALAGTVGVVDRYSFWLSVLVGSEAGPMSALALFHRTLIHHIASSFAFSCSSALPPPARWSYR